MAQAADFMVIVALILALLTAGYWARLLGTNGLLYVDTQGARTDGKVEVAAGLLVLAVISSGISAALAVAERFFG